MAPMAMAAPRPATAASAILRRPMRRHVCSSPPLANPDAFGSPQKQRGGRSLCRPRRFERMTYFRLVIAVRSAESFTMPAAPHQFEPNAVAPLPGLIAVTKPGLELVVL